MAIQQVMVAQAISGGGDPSWSNVSSLLHMDGPNGSTTFTDQKAKVWTPGSATISTAQSVFGGASGLFAGAGYISTPDHADFKFSSGDFTVEGWVRFSSITASYNGIICHDNIAGTRGWLLTKETSGYATPHAIIFGCNVGATQYIVSSAATPSASVWYYVAVVRDGGTLRFYLNGVQATSVAISGAINTITTPAYIGTLATGGAPSGFYMNGNLDEWRVTKGVCRYPGGTTFTVPASPFPNF